MTTTEEIVDAHKRAHGLTPESKLWNDPRWDTEWAFNVDLFLDALHSHGLVLARHWESELSYESGYAPVRRPL